MIQSRFQLLSAVHLFLLQGESILLLRRYNTGYEDGNYSVVAGHLNGGETVKGATIREAREEVGITLQPQDLEVVGVMHRRSDDERIDWFLAAHTWSGEIHNQEPQKCDQLAWHSLTSLPDNIIPYVRRAIQNYQHSRWFDSFGWQES